MASHVAIYKLQGSFTSSNFSLVLVGEWLFPAIVN